MFTCVPTLPTLGVGFRGHLWVLCGYVGGADVGVVDVLAERERRHGACGVDVTRDHIRICFVPSNVAAVRVHRLDDASCAHQFPRDRKIMNLVGVAVFTDRSPTR
jgi:hypothetical protein